jgi:hypothetical protein
MRSGAMKAVSFCKVMKAAGCVGVRGRGGGRRLRNYIPPSKPLQGILFTHLELFAASMIEFYITR